MLNTFEEKVVSIKSYCDVPCDEKILLKYVSIQPVSVAIEADMPDFQMYKRGILNYSKCGNSLDHGVTVVGYGSDNGLDYWVVKNSWNKSWGDGGYVRMLRGVNMCGISQQPSVPLM